MGPTCVTEPHHTPQPPWPLIAPAQHLLPSAVPGGKDLTWRQQAAQIRLPEHKLFSLDFNMISRQQKLQEPSPLQVLLRFPTQSRGWAKGFLQKDKSSNLTSVPLYRVSAAWGHLGFALAWQPAMALLWPALHTAVTLLASRKGSKHLTKFNKFILSSKQLEKQDINRPVLWVSTQVFRSDPLRLVSGRRRNTRRPVSMWTALKSTEEEQNQAISK